MAKNTKIWIGIAVIAVILIVGYVWYNGSKPIDNPNVNLPDNNISSLGKTYNIEITNLAFSTLSLTIKQGETVIWKNLDSQTHTVTSDKQDEMSSKLLKTNEVYSHTFNTAGTFDYHCEVHPKMKATIIVE
ncbi:MAG: plastocyanin/azurin family copper-binding protein [Candidatus Pacearchaeota archaeon]|jgi:plastocyanin